MADPNILIALHCSGVPAVQVCISFRNWPSVFAELLTLLSTDFKPSQDK